MKKQTVFYVRFGLSILCLFLLIGCHRNGLTSEQQAKLMSQQSKETHELMMTMMSNQKNVNSSQDTFTLEGMLRVHSKFLYKYYIETNGGQICALYGDENPQEFAKLESIKPDTYIRVHGRLGTKLYEGGTDIEYSQFGRTWVIYMEVEDVTTMDKSGS